MNLKVSPVKTIPVGKEPSVENYEVIRSAVPVTHASGAHVELVVYYDPYDPFAVIAEFRSGPNEAMWSFSRDLLADGMIEPAGLGDVRIRPHDKLELVLIELQPAPEAEIQIPTIFEASANELHAFLERTYKVVPGGTESEWMGIDEALADLFAEFE